jgi:hypothetical protein
MVCPCSTLICLWFYLYNTGICQLSSSSSTFAAVHTATKVNKENSSHAAVHFTKILQNVDPIAAVHTATKVNKENSSHAAVHFTKILQNVDPMIFFHNL